jgi:hypothetical protein
VLPDTKLGAVEYLIQHLWANRGGSTYRPRVGGGEPGSDNAGQRSDLPGRVREQLGPAAPLVG